MKHIILGFLVLILFFSIASADTVITDTGINMSGNFTTTSYGFFDIIGSLASRITSLFVQTLSVSGNATLNYVTNVDEIVFNTTHSGHAWSEGAVHWDSDENTLKVDMASADVHLQVGQESYVRAVNKAGFTIPDGSAVYIDGVQGNRPTINLALGNASDTSQILGVATHNIANNAEGYVTIAGVVNDVDTSDFGVGDVVYLSATEAGNYTNVSPSSPNFPIQVGTILVSHSSIGKLLVHLGPTDVTGTMVIYSADIINGFSANSMNITSLNGTGNDYACLDSNGQIYRSNTACA